MTAPPWQSGWAMTPPDLVAMARLRPQRISSVLTTGRRPDGSSPSPPMPPFRLSAEDAAAVIAYLQSLDAGQ